MYIKSFFERLNKKMFQTAEFVILWRVITCIVFATILWAGASSTNTDGATFFIATSVLVILGFFSGVIANTFTEYSKLFKTALGYNIVFIWPLAAVYLFISGARSPISGGLILAMVSSYISYVLCFGARFQYQLYKKSKGK